ncbi:MAG: ATP-binding protein, partial [Actinomycetota bacterium]
MIGRSAELSQLLRALEAASHGRGGAQLIAGESGVGKTRLLMEFARTVRGRATVLAGACLDLVDGAPPYWPVTDALRGLPTPSDAPEPTTLDALLPGDGGPSATGRRAQDQLFGQVLDLLVAAAGHRPIVLMMEDLHWA